MQLTFSFSWPMGFIYGDQLEAEFLLFLKDLFIYV